jgi:hypothetical protein
MTMWGKWCSLHGHQPMPASPTMIARFIAELAPLGISEVWPAVLEISRAHYCIGLPDPTVSAPVVTEINKISGISPPRSWPAEDQIRFRTLPYDLQLIVSKREADRDRQIRQMITERGKKEKTNGTFSAEAIESGA